MIDRICVAIGEKSRAESITAALGQEKKADVIEIRLDMMKDPAIRPFLFTLQTPLLFTNRAEWEGGEFRGSEEDRIALLLEAMDFGAAYIDLEERSPDASWDVVLARKEKEGTKIICSWHNFDETPDENELLQTFERMKKRGADIIKIVTMAKTTDDVRRVLNLQKSADEAGVSLVAFCMGEIGVISRVAATQLGGYMTYCSTDESEGTAPGQVPVSAMKNILKLMGREQE